MFSSAKKLHRVLSSGEIRKTFIDYFTLKRDHKFVRSSPVVPFCDSSLAFVNAGMNQFKSIFLGTTPAPSPRVANSQKCVRVGGKHNDLNIVGQDGYHHTFFEMLGNWSFGDYFKRDACTMALELLRENYGIDQRRMYVTYFTGDKALNLPPDMETYEIWRNLGFPSERVVGFGTEHNFWEMGAIGPCGPCTEIHLDNLPEVRKSSEGAKLVNKGYADLTELWNLVFIQYKRNDDGSITTLPAKHVDTGMGFERLTAFMQGKSSNYDTDLFVPIFNGIQQHCKIPSYGGTFGGRQADDLDTNYRIMADHMRMISVCLADGMLPDMNQKLRRVMRKIYAISERVFNNETLPYALIPIITDTLGDAYPELCDNQNAIKDILQHEQEVYKSVRADSRAAFCSAIKDFPQLEGVDLIECPGFVPAYREFQLQKLNFISNNNNTIPGEFLFKMHDTYGLNEEYFHKMAFLDHMDLDLSGYWENLADAKRFTRPSAHEIRTLKHGDLLADWTNKLPNTEYRYIYCHTYNDQLKEYQVPALYSQVVSMLYDEEFIMKGKNEELLLSVVPFTSNAEEEHVPATEQNTLYVVTDASNFYVEAGGQQADRGEIHITPNDKEFAENWVLVLTVIDLRFINNCVVHVCQLPAKLKYIGDRPKIYGTTLVLNGKLTAEHNTGMNNNTEEDDDDDDEIESKRAQRAAYRAKIENECKEVSVKVGDDVRLIIDQERRKLNSCHHTAVHMLNGAIRSLFKKVTFQVGSSVTTDQGKLEVGLIGKRLTKQDIMDIENLLKNIIKSAIPVTLKKTNALVVMQSKDITMIPGEIYPETGLRIITIHAPLLDYISKELCCGTHVGNTSVLEDICVTNFKQTNRARFAFTIAARQQAKQAYDNIIDVKESLNEVEMDIKKGNFKKNAEHDMQLLRHQMLNGDMLLPYLYKLEAIERIDGILRKLKDHSRVTLNEFVDAEMRMVLQEQTSDKHKFILHYLDSSELMEEVPLQKATRLCKDRPILVVANCDGVIQARCCVPKQYQSENFDAEKWLNKFSSVFACPISAPKGQVLKNVSLMKGRKLRYLFDDQLDEAITRAQEFAEENLQN